jgi:predicted AlkP superfamily pyrophosphatase or phosphodiesterase
MLSCGPDLSVQSMFTRIFRRPRSYGKLLRWVAAIGSIFVVAGFTLPTSHTQQDRSPTNARVEPRAGQLATTKPRLILLIVVDQFRFDYLTRFGDLFGSRGIGRLVREGAQWTDAEYEYVPTYTAPGHAATMTGSWPKQNGIVGNEWFERETNLKVSSVTDKTVTSLGGGAGESGYSPRRLLCPTVGDELRSQGSDGTKVLGISVKARSAILPAGQRASGAYWFSMDSGNMVSSSYYFKDVPEWVTRFNKKRIPDRWFGARWDRLLPESEYLKRAGKDDVPWENLDKSSHDTNFFPHIVTGGAAAPSKDFYRALDYSPFSNDLLLSFAQEAITNEKLGDDEQTDVLTVSFSANDYVGHRFGPNSQEVMDMALRVDAQIGQLLDFIDGRAGLKNTVVIFTSDHGVVAIPEELINQRATGGRAAESDLRTVVENGLKQRYARPDRPATDYVQTFGSSNEPGVINSNFYLNRAALKRDGIDLAECEEVVGRLAATMPGVAGYFTRTQIESNRVSLSDPIARRVINGFHSQRSGDVVVVMKPYHVLFDVPASPTDLRSTTTHGSAYSYDSHVPLIIMGPGFSPGTYKQPAAPADIAPTLARMLGIKPPRCSVGRILSEVMK